MTADAGDWPDGMCCWRPATIRIRLVDGPDVEIVDLCREHYDEMIGDFATVELEHHQDGSWWIWARGPAGRWPISADTDRKGFVEGAEAFRCALRDDPLFMVAVCEGDIDTFHARAVGISQQFHWLELPDDGEET